MACRYNSIDILRALEIIEMITGHVNMLMTKYDFIFGIEWVMNIISKKRE